MLNVFFTIDVEVWCNGWENIDERFADAFQRYIYGTTPQGRFGLPYQLKAMNDHGLISVCFIEPLFSARFGQQYLDEIVSLVCGAGHEPQLHMHTEWVDEARTPLLEGMDGKRPNMRDYSVAEQASLIASGLQMLARAGAPSINAFRAGSFAFNRDTLEALAINGIMYDSSFNTTMFGPTSGVRPGETVWWPFECAGVYEYPMTVFDGGTRKLRHVQLTACSFSEIEKLLWNALEAGYSSFVILSHSFELLNGGSRDRPDPVTINRFRKLCAFLDKNRDSFRMRGFQGLEPEIPDCPPPMLRSPIWQTGRRMLEQAYRRRYG
ncbi:MAG TPA: hypothetical protein PLL92_03665 [Alicycliphilus sp.]|nr:hypothetical protein [Alicycliphilus sp.]